MCHDQRNRKGGENTRRLGREIKHRARGGNDSSEGDCDVTTFHSSLPSRRSAEGEGSAGPGPRSLATGSPGTPGGPVLGGRRRRPSLEPAAPRVTGPKSPGGNRRGRGLGCQGWGGGTGEKTLGGGAKGRRGVCPVCLRGSTDSDHRPAVGGALGLVREPRPRHVLPFSWPRPICSVGFLPTSREGEGPYLFNPSDHCGIASGSRRAVLRVSQKRRNQGTKQQRYGRGLYPLIPLVYEKDVSERGRGYASAGLDGRVESQ